VPSRLLTEELLQEVAAGVEEGHDPMVVAVACGVTDRSFRNWIKAGKEDQTQETIEYRFFRAVTRARAKAEMDLGRRTMAGDEKGASFGPAKAALEVLSRRIPGRWAQRVNIKVERELEELLEVVEGICSPQDFERVLEALAARDSSQEAGFDTGEA
jgi:hypothetical protein